MRKAIEAFDREFAQWEVTLPARDVVDREAGHMERHGWSLDYSFGSDAFGEYLEYHGRRAVSGEPVIERHVRVYENGERNFIPAPAANGDADAGDRDADGEPEAGAEWARRPTLPPWESMLSDATGGEHRRPMSAATKREPARGTVRVAPRHVNARPHDADGPEGESAWKRHRPTLMAFALGIGGALMLALVVVGIVRAVRGRPPAAVATLAADPSTLDPIVVFAPAVVNFSTDSAASRFTQPLVGGRRDPSKAEVVNPEHGMTPIIPSDPNKKSRTKPAPTSRGGKFHVP